MPTLVPVILAISPLCSLPKAYDLPQPLAMRLTEGASDLGRSGPRKACREVTTGLGAVQPSPVTAHRPCSPRADGSPRRPPAARCLPPAPWLPSPSAAWPGHVRPSHALPDVTVLSNRPAARLPRTRAPWTSGRELGCELGGQSWESRSAGHHLSRAAAMSSDDSSLMVRERWAACVPGYFCSQDSSALGLPLCSLAISVLGLPLCSLAICPWATSATLSTLLPVLGLSLLWPLPPPATSTFLSTTLAASRSPSIFPNSLTNAFLPVSFTPVASN